MSIAKILVVFSFLSVLTVSLTYFFFFSPPGGSSEKVVFAVPPKTAFEKVLADLQAQGFIRRSFVLNLVWNWSERPRKVTAGGYLLSRNQNVLEVAEKISRSTDFKWVTVYPGERKEQIGELLGQTFGWGEDEIKRFNEYIPYSKTEYFEGVYFPDTYLIPVGESAEEMARRLVARFEEKFSPLATKFLEKNIKWDSALKVASLVQREAGGPADMPLVAGVIWNRLSKGMKLDIDATVQYALGSKEHVWWGRVRLNDLKVDSPYNSYLHAGLPPHPIANPGIAAIEAVLNPAQTQCLYYLHDRAGQIHCSETYDEHLRNIRKFLD